MTSFVMLPQVSANGYYPYSPASKQYGTQDTIDAMVRIAQDWFRNQRYEIGIGDISYHDGSAMPPHQSHRNGRNVDVRPLRRDHANSPVDITSPQYDRAATRLLVESLLAHANVEGILFNDREIEGVTWYEGHDNHLHVKMLR